MKRREFLYKAGLTTMGVLTLKDLANFASSAPAEEQVMPMMFVGHGNPMNAIEDNEYSRYWRTLGARLPKPKAILCISAHWLTRGTQVCIEEKPQTIHDFGGFPKALFDAQYPAPGAPIEAHIASTLIQTTKVEEVHDWGLDHGAWSVLMPMFPNADIPVFQMSIDYTKNPEYHYQLAKELSSLRKKGVLIMGSGNIVHNLGRVQFSEQAYDWAVEFDAKAKELIVAHDHDALIHYEKLGTAAKLSIPTNDHYLPLLYILGLQNEKDKLSFFNEKTTMGSISMTSVLLEQA